MTAGAFMSVAYSFIGWSLFFWTASGDLLFFIQAFHFSLLDACATFSRTLSISMFDGFSQFPHKKTETYDIITALLLTTSTTEGGAGTD
jgi:hypothetical protein